MFNVSYWCWTALAILLGSIQTEESFEVTQISSRLTIPASIDSRMALFGMFKFRPTFYTLDSINIPGRMEFLLG